MAAGLSLLCALDQAPVLAATINVGGSCTLVDAINSANSNTPIDGCDAGSGADTIVLAPNAFHVVTTVNNTAFGPTGLPVITTEITIQGNGAGIRRDSSAPEFRILAVDADGDLTLVNVRVSGGVVSGGEGSDSGGIDNFGTLTLTNSTVSGNTAGDDGGGISNSNNGTVTLTNSTVSGNTAGDNGGGINNNGTMTLTNSTASGNTAQFGGGIDNDGTMTLTNSTVSGNAASIDGGGIDNFGTVTLTNSTASGNLAGSRGGGISNSATGIVMLVQSLLSGNTASTDGSEARNEGTAIADDFNLFGHDGLSGVVGFSPGTFDIVPSEPIAAILDTTLRNNGGPTMTHALVTGSPAIDFAPCVTATDQRGVARPQDGDGDTGADCDIGAFEALPTPVDTDGDGLADFEDNCPTVFNPTQSDTDGDGIGDACESIVPPVDTDGDGIPDSIDLCPTTLPGQPVQANGCPLPPPDTDGDGVRDSLDSCPGTPPGTPVQANGCPFPVVPPLPVVVNPTNVPCNGARCNVQIACAAGTVSCINTATITVARKLTGKARLVTMAAGVANTPPGSIGTIKMRTNKVGRQVVKANRGKRIRGRLTITNGLTGAVLSATPIKMKIR